MLHTCFNLLPVSTFLFSQLSDLRWMAIDTPAITEHNLTKGLRDVEKYGRDEGLDEQDWDEQEEELLKVDI